MTILDLLKIEEVISNQNTVILKMPITENIIQPFKIVHGGVNAIISETAASIAGNHNLDDSKYAVGLSINTNHLRPVLLNSGKFLFAKATPIHIGKNIQTWNVITYVDDNQNKITSNSIATLSVINK
ncbi:MAG: PaaI family thioesterase [Lactobacillaceae bacterium]|jgi:uncharacterized protein (TIGR00369 family)|nr:PaaI family thioesterase [Lactobacillaceae bacterium]